MALSLEHKLALATLCCEESITRSALVAALEDEADGWRRRAMSIVFDTTKNWEQKRDSLTEYAARVRQCEGMLATLAAKGSK